MVNDWYTLRALSREWTGQLKGARIDDVYSAARDELSIALSGDGIDDTLRISVAAANRYVFLQAGTTRPRKNITTLFETVIGRTVGSVDAADRDRLFDINLAGSGRIRVVLFGPGANVWAADESGSITESFRLNQARGAVLPEPDAAPHPLDPASLAARWPAEARPVEQAVKRAYPLFDRWLAREVVDRAEIDTADACLVTPADLEALANAARSVHEDLVQPDPVLYRAGREPVALSLIPLRRAPAPDTESATSVSEAVRQFVRANLAFRAFRSEYDPLRRTIEKVAVRNATRSERMLTELAKTSRADRYEHWGHLLMAVQPDVKGLAAVDVPDLFAERQTVTIPVDPRLSLVENAEKHYDRARRTRRSREQAEKRLESVDSLRRSAEALLAELDVVEDRAALKAFRKTHAEALEAFAREQSADTPNQPFRRYDLGGGYEAWVGRSAKENDLLTFRHARRHDWWLHARGVPGSHVVLRNPKRDERPPRSVIEAAAAIAAAHSKAAGAQLVPVIVVPRKYVRKPRGAGPGAVVVEREEVVLVEPSTS